MISDFLSANSGIAYGEKRELEFELERNHRIMNDYRLTKEKLFDYIAGRIENVSQIEFEQWLTEGRFDMLHVNGESRFVNPSVSNLFFRYPELRKRRKNYSTESLQARLTLAQARRAKSMYQEGGDAVVLPRRCRVTQTLHVKDEIVPDGETVRCWLPYPSIFATQTDVQFISSSPDYNWIAHPTSPIRSVYLERINDEGARFELNYYYTAYAYYSDIVPGLVELFSGTEPEYEIYTREEPPHEIFSALMRQLSAKIIRNEENPYLKARLIYNWVADSIRYSYAREYSTLRNISAYCLDKKYGDCGQEAILFITLCRIAGVPARWQSGFLTFPGQEGMHDWAEIFIKPYGWIPVDPYMGIFFTSMTEDLSPGERREMRAYYFGNIDNYRLVANKGHNQILYPPKKHFRSETVDFQRGEVEWAEKNLYFTDWSWSIEVKEVNSAL
jgi:hypothetical protein